MTSTAPLPSPLAGIKVVELSHLIAGPYCCQMLADEGATVVKVEPPAGELTRHREPARRSDEGDVTAYYASLNRGKSSVVLDLKNPEGVALMIDSSRRPTCSSPTCARRARPAGTCTRRRCTSATRG